MADLDTNLTRLTNARSNIATAIGDKGITVPVNSGFEDFPDLIEDIQIGPAIEELTFTNIYNNATPTRNFIYSTPYGYLGDLYFSSGLYFGYANNGGICTKLCSIPMSNYTAGSSTDFRLYIRYNYSSTYSTPSISTQEYGMIGNISSTVPTSSNFTSAGYYYLDCLLYKNNNSYDLYMGNYYFRDKGYFYLWDIRLFCIN